MNATQVLDHFDRISDAPNAIPSLRRFILDLAVRGKLVDQDHNDEPASELSNRLLAAKTRLIRNGSLKRQSEATPKLDEPTEFATPHGWIVTTLGDVAEKITDGTHKTPHYIDEGIPFVSVKDFSAGQLDFSHTRFISPEEHAVLYKRCDPRRGDILIGRIGTLGKAVLVDTDKEFSLFVSVGLIHFNHDFIAPKFLCLLLNSPFVESEFDRIKIGGATHTNKLNLGDLYTVILPLPPFSEQHRIVAKVDELMKLCDRLETAQAERESRRDKLAAASLHRLNNGADADEFREHARVYLRYFPHLTYRPEQIPQLRQTILNLAVHGKLLQQSPTDESPKSLLREIHEMRAQSPNRSKNSNVDDSDQKFVRHLPEALPPNWIVCPLDDLFRFIDYRGRTPIRTANGVRLITAKNVRMGYVADEPIEFINEQIYGSWMTRGFPQNGDLLFVTEGATMGYVGMIDLQFTFALAQRTIDLQPYLPSYSKFFLFTLMSPLFQEAILTNSTGTAVKGIKAAKLRRIRVPLPPVAEQHRIVAKVDELMALCDRLEAQLTTTQTESRRLLEAVLHEALNEVL